MAGNRKANDFGANYPDLAFTAIHGTAVPEAGTWLMLILGFGGMGVLLRRRATSAATVAHA